MADKKKPEQQPFDFNMDFGDMSFDFDPDKPTGDPRTGGVNRARSMLAEGYDTLDVNIPEDAGMEEAAREEVGQVLSKIRENAAKSMERIEANTTSQYYFTVVFLDRKQREAFLNATGWREFGLQVLDGIDLAKKLGVDLPESAYKPAPFHANARLSEISLEIDDDIYADKG